jgi:hypothetical protein
MERTISPSWLSELRVRRAGTVLLRLSTQGDVSNRRFAVKHCWRAVGGSLDEVDDTIQLLVELQLVTSDKDRVGLSFAGKRVARALESGKVHALALTLIRAGYFHVQVLRLLELAIYDEHGNLTCDYKAARTNAGMVTSLLTWWPDVKVRPNFLVPSELAKELHTLVAITPPPKRWLEERYEVGERAEAYSFQLERTNATDASKIRWVSRESDAFGWDMEDDNQNPQRLIEVKGRRDGSVEFYLSENEWTQAQANSSRYELHFWGEIDLRRDRNIEYAVLRESGYPLVIRDLASTLLDAAHWKMSATDWRVARLSVES